MSNVFLKIIFCCEFIIFVLACGILLVCAHVFCLFYSTYSASFVLDYFLIFLYVVFTTCLCSLFQCFVLSRFFYPLYYSLLSSVSCFTFVICCMLLAPLFILSLFDYSFTPFDIRYSIFPIICSCRDKSACLCLYYTTDALCFAVNTSCVNCWYP